MKFSIIKLILSMFLFLNKYNKKGVMRKQIRETYKKLYDRVWQVHEDRTRGLIPS